VKNIVIIVSLLLFSAVCFSQNKSKENTSRVFTKAQLNEVKSINELDLII